MGTLLDQKFRAAYNLTYFTMGGIKNVDTSKFRRAIWNYIQCIYGIRHDDYDYGEVNQVGVFQYSKCIRLFFVMILKCLYHPAAAGSSPENVHKNCLLFSRTNHNQGLWQHTCGAAGQWKGKLISAKQDGRSIKVHFSSFQVHVNLMIMEARNQAELLYALREIMRYMTWSQFSFLFMN